MSSLFKSTTTYDPIKTLLNAGTEEERNELTQKWKDNKLQELNFVGIVGALLAGVLTSTGSWPSILSNGKIQPWTVRACWYSGTLFALASVLSAAQQSIRLHRLSCHKYDSRNIRRLMAHKRPDRHGQKLPRRGQVYVWQLSVICLEMSVIAMMAGMFILIWSSTGSIFSGRFYEWWNGDAKLAVTFTIVAVVIGCFFVMEQVCLYSFQGPTDADEDESES